MVIPPKAGIIKGLGNNIPAFAGMAREGILRIFVICFLSLTFIITQANASNKNESLAAIQNRLAAETKQKEILESKKRTIESEFKKTRDDLVSIGKSVQENEKNLNELEQKITTLNTRKIEISTRLTSDRAQTARLILALERIRRVPPEALITRPEAPIKTAQTQMLLGSILPSLYENAEKLRTGLAELNTISSDLESRRISARKTGETLKAEVKKLESLVKKRESLFAEVDKDYKAQQASIKQLSAQATSLKDLMRRLDKKRERDTAESSPRRKSNAAPPGPGQARLPAPGTIMTRYNEPDGFGAPSKGLTIKTRSGGLVVAPMGGVVRFTGEFRNYGQMVIIEHQGGYHSLIAGLGKIDTVVGQSISAGEPLGRLRRTDDATLYFELRYNGEPVNPARKLTDLS